MSTGGYFSLGRTKPLPSLYSDQLRAVTHDVVLAGWITAFLLIYVSFLVILPGYPSRKGWKVYMRVAFDLFVGLAIILGIFGQDWEVAELENVMTPYKPGSGKEIHADIGLHIGIQSINITLRETPEEHRGHHGNPGNETHEGTAAGTSEQHGAERQEDAGQESSDHRSAAVKETINYNERFWWTWRQGRLGFGTEAGTIQIEFREAQIRGVPIPILWVAEYFIIDGEGIRFGRRYRTAGWYAHFLLWCAFAAWILQNILMRMVVRRGAAFMIITGVFMFLANIVWMSIRNQPVELAIPFGSKPEEILRTRYGFHFWTCLLAGIESIFFGVCVYILDELKPSFTTDYFDVDPLLEYQEAIVTATDFEQERRKTPGQPDSASGRWETMELMPVAHSNGASSSRAVDGEFGILLRPKNRRTMIFSKVNK